MLLQNDVKGWVLVESPICITEPVFHCYCRDIMLRIAAEAKRACNALLWLFGEADAAVQLLRSWEIEAEVAEGLDSSRLKV